MSSGTLASPAQPVPLLARILLLRPRRVQLNLERLAALGHPGPIPTLWQVATGVLRMVHRMVFRSETIGQSVAFPVRDNRRARLLQYRPLRFPFLVWERSIAPLDLSGLVSPPARITRHLLGTHHDGLQFVYDFQLLACHPGALEALRDQARDVVEHDTQRARWLRDLAVYESYHENLLAAVEAALAGDLRLSPADELNPDVSLTAWLGWCAAQPLSPRATWRAWRAGDFTFAP